MRYFYFRQKAANLNSLNCYWCLNSMGKKEKKIIQANSSACHCVVIHYIIMFYLTLAYTESESFGTKNLATLYPRFLSYWENISCFLPKSRRCQLRLAPYPLYLWSQALLVVLRPAVSANPIQCTNDRSIDFCSMKNCYMAMWILATSGVNCEQYWYHVFITVLTFREW